uniref:BZIP domain-containing protein n=1 Tax=Aegilops tauschii subsp. strangulata TaxID=200361 RepID=A0A453KC97_AEGTS
QIQTLVREGSLYNLTLSEVESHLGAPLLSMNLDDFVRSVLPDEKNLPLPNGAGNSGSHSTSAFGLERQGSSITVPLPLSKKTVDEIWRNIQQEEESSDDEKRSSGCEAQMSFGEITLEEFLQRAGIVTGQYQKDAEELIDLVGTGESAHLMTRVQDFPQGTSAIDAYIVRQSIAQPLSVAIPSAMDSIYPDRQMSISSSLELSDLQSPSHKRMSSQDVVYKVADRRQKRMIKNRESAARSRARKQGLHKRARMQIVLSGRGEQEAEEREGVGHVIEVRAPSRTEKTSSENEIDLILIVCRVQASGRF